MSEFKMARTFLILSFFAPLAIVASIFTIMAINGSDINQNTFLTLFGIWLGYGAIYSGVYLLYQKGFGEIKVQYLLFLAMPIIIAVGAVFYIPLVIKNLFIFIQGDNNIY